MAWLYLFLAGLSEVGWAIGLKAPQRLGSIFSANSEPATALRLACIGLLVVGIVGLKFAV